MKRIERSSSPQVILLQCECKTHTHTLVYRHTDARRDRCGYISAVAGELQTFLKPPTAISAPAHLIHAPVGDVVASCRRRQKNIKQKAPAARTVTTTPATRFICSHAITRGRAEGRMSLLGRNLQTAKQDPSERSIGAGKQITASRLYSLGR